MSLVSKATVFIYKRSTSLAILNIKRRDRLYTTKAGGGDPQVQLGKIALTDPLAPRAASSASAGGKNVLNFVFGLKMKISTFFHLLWIPVQQCAFIKGASKTQGKSQKSRTERALTSELLETPRCGYRNC